MYRLRIYQLFLSFLLLMEGCLRLVIQTFLTLIVPNLENAVDLFVYCSVKQDDMVEVACNESQRTLATNALVR